MRDDLHRASVVSAGAFVLNHLVVNFSDRNAVVFGDIDARKARKVAQIQIGFRAVFGNIYFAVLKRADVSRVEVDVRIAFYHRNRKPAAFEKTSERCGRNPFTETGTHAARHEYIFAHSAIFPFTPRFVNRAEKSDERQR